MCTKINMSIFCVWICYSQLWNSFWPNLMGLWWFPDLFFLQSFSTFSILSITAAPVNAAAQINSLRKKKNRSTHRRFVWWLFFWTLDVAVGGLGGVGGVKVLAGTWTAGCNSCQENDVRTAVGVTTSLQQVWYTSSRQDCPLTQEFLNTFRVLGQIWSNIMITNTPQKIRRKKFRMT